METVTSMPPLIRQKFRKDLLTMWDYSTQVKEKLLPLISKFSRRFNKLPVKRRIKIDELIYKLQGEYERLKNEEADFRAKAKETAQNFRISTGKTVRFSRYNESGGKSNQ